MNIVDFLINWDWCNRCGVQNVFHMLKEILNIVRIAVPIILVAMTTVDVVKKVINPDEKEGQKTIMNRAIAALIVFLIPTLIRITFKVVDWGMDKTGTYDSAESGLSRCWNGTGGCEE